MSTKEARQRANVKYRKKAYDRMELNLPKGKKEMIQEFALMAGESLNGYVSRAIDERIEREKDAR